MRCGSGSMPTRGGASSGCIWADNARNWLKLPEAAVADMAAGREVAPVEGYEVGAMFVRIAIDQVASIGDFQRMVTLGEVVRSGGEP